MWPAILGKVFGFYLIIIKYMAHKSLIYNRVISEFKVLCIKLFKTCLVRCVVRSWTFRFRLDVEAIVGLKDWRSALDLQLRTWRTSLTSSLPCRVVVSRSVRRPWYSSLLRLLDWHAHSIPGCIAGPKNKDSGWTPLKSSSRRWRRQWSLCSSSSTGGRNDLRNLIETSWGQ